MLSKSGMKDEKGISKVAIIIIVVVLLLLVVAGILYFVLTANKNASEQQNNENTINQEALLDTNDEITVDEKKNLKENYLGVFAILTSDKYQTDEQKLVAVAEQIVSMKEQKNGSVTGTSTNTNNSNVINTTQNAIENTSNTTITNETMVNNTIVVSDDNAMLANTINNGNTQSSLNSGSINMNIGGSSSASNSSANKEAEMEVALNEIKGEKIDNLSNVLAQTSQASQLTGFVTDIISIEKVKGVYDITYKVCWPTQAQMIKYGTMDKINTAAIDRLESTTVKITLTKNLDYEYSEYKIKSIQEIEKNTPKCYYATYVNNKFGVIDQSGNTILENAYDWIDIPNNYKDIFVCKTGDNVVVLNSVKEQMYENYKNISVIQSTAGGETRWYEKDLLVYEENGKYGAIDYDGFEVFEPIYDKIEPLYYIEGKLILTENGKQALADITGKINSNFKYTKIGVLGGQFELSSLVNSQRTLEQIQAMVQNGLYIVGQDVNGTVEIIKNITNAEANVDFSSLPQINYPTAINEWQLRSLDGTYLLYIK